jgi:hypothetical protein
MNCEHLFRPLVEDKGWLRQLTATPRYPFICLHCATVHWYILARAHELGLVVLSNAGNES